MTACRRLIALATIMLALAIASIGVAGPAAAQERPTHIAARLVADGPAIPGRPLTLAIAFDPEPGWHGYWKNPGDAGYGMTLDWQLPQGWSAGEPQYPVPQELVLGGMMNHVYEGPYAVLVDVAVPQDAAAASTASIALDAQWLACTDKICVPEQAHLTLDLSTIPRDGAFDRWRAAIPAQLDSPARFAVRGERLWIAIPLPASMAVGDPHVFLAERDIVQYAGTQTFTADGDLLIAGLPLAEGALVPQQVSGILSFGDGNGVRFAAAPGPVPANGVPLRTASGCGSDRPDLAAPARRTCGRSAAQRDALRVPDPEPQGAEPRPRRRKRCQGPRRGARLRCGRDPCDGGARRAAAAAARGG